MSAYAQKNRGFTLRGFNGYRNCYCGRPGKVSEYMMGRLSASLCVQHAKEARQLWAQHLCSMDEQKAA